MLPFQGLPNACDLLLCLCAHPKELQDIICNDVTLDSTAPRWTSVKLRVSTLQSSGPPLRKEMQPGM